MNTSTYRSTKARGVIARFEKKSHEGRQQQGGKECAGGFHCAISGSNAIRKPMEMFL